VAGRACVSLRRTEWVLPAPKRRVRVGPKALGSGLAVRLRPQGLRLRALRLTLRAGKRRARLIRALQTQASKTRAIGCQTLLVGPL
jgi:hypothetical protein